MIFKDCELWCKLENKGHLMPLHKKFKSKQFYETTLFCRFFFSYLCLLSIGIGSWMFHMTLQYEMQLMDELPMVYACAVFVYCLYEVTLWSSREYVISMFRDKHSDCILYLWGYPLALKIRHWPVALKISLCPQQCVHGG